MDEDEIFKTTWKPRYEIRILLIMSIHKAHFRLSLIWIHYLPLGWGRGTAGETVSECVCVRGWWIMWSIMLGLLPSPITNDGGETWSITAHTHILSPAFWQTHSFLQADKPTHTKMHIKMHTHAQWPLQLCLFLNAWEWKHSSERVPRDRVRDRKWEIERHGGSGLCHSQ